MESKKYISTSELAKILGVSRIAVYKRVKKGQIKAMRVGRSFVIPKKYADNILGKKLNALDKKEIDEAVRRTVKEYGEVLKKLGRE